MTKFVLDLDIDNSYFEYPKYAIPLLLGFGMYYNRYNLLSIANYATDLYLDIKYSLFPKQYITKTNNNSSKGAEGTECANWSLINTFESSGTPDSSGSPGSPDSSGCTCYQYLYNCQKFYICVPLGIQSPYVPTFPLYKDNEIETALLPEYNNVKLVYYNTETKTQEVICDIDDIWTQLAGPKQDFYYDFNLPICLYHLLPIIIKQSNISTVIPIENFSVSYTDMFDNQQIIKYYDCLMDLKQIF